jgi:hypothetical protein
MAKRIQQSRHSSRLLPHPSEEDISSLSNYPLYLQLNPSPSTQHGCKIRGSIDALPMPWVGMLPIAESGC